MTQSKTNDSRARGRKGRAPSFPCPVRWTKKQTGELCTLGVRWLTPGQGHLLHIAFGASHVAEENWKILGNKIHDIAGDKYYHGMYMGTAYQVYQENNLMEIAWNELCDFTDTGSGDDAGGPSGIYIHPTDSLAGPADNVFIHDNIIHNLPHAGIHVASRV
jgi:hypothetical protein